MSFLHTLTHDQRDAASMADLFLTFYSRGGMFGYRSTETVAEYLEREKVGEEPEDVEYLEATIKWLRKQAELSRAMEPRR